MKYKVGDEVLVKVRIHHIVNQETDLPYEVKAINNGKIEPRTIWIREEDIQSDSTMTAEEAWEIAKKIADMLCEESNKIFGTAHLEHILQRNTPQEAKAKIEAWEAEKNINVGDVVIRCGESCIVTNKSRDDGFYDVLFEDGTTGAYQRSSLKKTGRHIDIEWILKQIGGNE